SGTPSYQGIGTVYQSKPAGWIGFDKSSLNPFVVRVISGPEFLRCAQPAPTRSTQLTWKVLGVKMCGMHIVFTRICGRRNLSFKYTLSLIFVCYIKIMAKILE